MLKVKFGTAESKLKKHIGTHHSFCAQRQSDLAEKRNLLSAVPQFTFSSHAIYFQHFPYYQHGSTPTSGSGSHLDWARIDRNCNAFLGHMLPLSLFDKQDLRASLQGEIYPRSVWPLTTVWSRKWVGHIRLLQSLIICRLQNDCTHASLINLKSL